VVKSNLRFSPDILIRLGEELVPNPTDGLLELVKNAYDADASFCAIKIEKHTIRIEDDGDGMTDSDIEKGWLLIGGSRKDAKHPTALGRIPVGNKGLGRLAALRLGNKATLVSRPKCKSNTEYRIAIDWDKVEQGTFVEQEYFDIISESTTKGKGTEVILEMISEALPPEEIQKLSKSLILLSDPFDNEAGFYASVQCSLFKGLSSVAKNNYFADADYHLKAAVDEKGHPFAQVLDWQDKVLFSSKPEDFKSKRYKTPSASFDLWNFKLGGQSFSAKNTPVPVLREWLGVVGGVHLYHRKMRVRPFGEPGYDWLAMDVKRAGSPEERPSTNNSIGQIKVEDLNQLLTQKTDRTGFIENEAFRELKRFAIDALNWMATRRLAVAEEKRETKRSSTTPAVIKAKAKLEETVRDKVPRKNQRAVLSAVKRFESAKHSETSALKEDLQLYRSLATAGTTSAVFAHESHKPLTNILSVADTIKLRAKDLLGDLFHQKLENPLSLLVSAAKALQSFSYLPLNLLRREKRRTGVVDLVETAKELVGYLKPFFTDAQISLELKKPANPVQIAGSQALVESILANLALNALKAFANSRARVEGRLVEIRIEMLDDNAVLKVLDNGPGIRGIGLDEIWLPGRTTSPDGTGFGLTIVRDSITDLRGTRTVLANGELGGAEFTITLPLTH
jgi:signal transduction histidine kinase